MKKFVFIILSILTMLSLLMNSKSFAYVDTDTDNNMSYYINDTFLEYLQDSSFYNSNYTYFAWGTSYNNTILWSVIFVPSNTYDYIADINTTTNTITWNSDITPFYKSVSNAENDFPNISSITLSNASSLGQYGWVNQSNVKVITTGAIGADYCRYFFGSAGSVIFNGNLNSRPNFDSLPMPNNQAYFINLEDPDFDGQRSLIQGEGSYFYFQIKKNPNYPNESFYPIWVYIHDVTNIQPPSYDYVNNTTSVYVDLNLYNYNEIGRNYVFAFGSPPNEPDVEQYGLPFVYPFRQLFKWAHL